MNLVDFIKLEGINVIPKGNEISTTGVIKFLEKQDVSNPKISVLPAVHYFKVGGFMQEFSPTFNNGACYQIGLFFKGVLYEITEYVRLKMSQENKEIIKFSGKFNQDVCVEDLKHYITNISTEGPFLTLNVNNLTLLDQLGNPIQTIKFGQE
ncbi:MAG: hypothetical protein JW791_05375 [Nanoarchaeota archaeon]|nr:hypothetical protein [Nanoarchaeota archaeon]